MKIVNETITYFVESLPFTLGVLQQPVPDVLMKYTVSQSDAHDRRDPNVETPRFFAIIDKIGSDVDNARTPTIKAKPGARSNNV